MDLGGKEWWFGVDRSGNHLAVGGEYRVYFEFRMRRLDNIREQRGTSGLRNVVGDEDAPAKLLQTGWFRNCFSNLIFLFIFIYCFHHFPLIPAL